MAEKLKHKALVAALRGSSEDELKERVKRLEEELFQHRLKRYTNQLENTNLIRATRREIALAKTVLSQRKHGTETQGAPPAKAAEEPAGSEEPEKMSAETTETAARSSSRRTLIGVVTSDKMTKTVVVQVSRRVRSEQYKKYMTKRVKYKAHNENPEIHVGDRVEIVESRPLSKDKRWRVARLVEKARNA